MGKNLIAFFNASCIIHLRKRGRIRHIKLFLLCLHFAYFPSDFRLVYKFTMLASAALVIVFFATESSYAHGKYLKFSNEGVKSFWSQWTAWSACTLTTICLGGAKTRKRKCIKQSPKSSSCSGVYVESKECPENNCKHLKPMIYTDVAEAPMSSFISQECSTDIKYSVASKRGKSIPQPILSRFKEKIMNFLHGFFYLQTLIEKPELGLKNMTKVCFEPRDLKVKDLPRIFRFNRLVKASLGKGVNISLKPDDTVYGVVVVVEDDSGLFHGIFYAVKGKYLGYKSVGYRRWRGQGVLDALS